MGKIRDDLGQEISLPGPARRIVSLSPSATENLFAIGAGASVVGVTAACDFPAAAKGLPKVGDFMRPSYERIVALKPDLIVVESATAALRLAADAFRLREKTRCPVFVQGTLRVDDVPRHLEQLGALTGRDAAARVARLRRDLAAVPVAKPVAVFIEVSPTPLYGVGPHNVVDDLIRRAGGRNVLVVGGAFPVVSKEVLLSANPAVYIVAGPRHPFAPPLDRLAAVKNGRVVSIPPDLLFRGTARLVDGLSALRAALAKK